MDRAPSTRVKPEPQEPSISPSKSARTLQSRSTSRRNPVPEVKKEENVGATRLSGGQSSGSTHTLANTSTSTSNATATAKKASPTKTEPCVSTRATVSKSSISGSVPVASPNAPASNSAKKPPSPVMNPKPPIPKPASVNTLRNIDKVLAVLRNALTPGTPEKPPPPPQTGSPASTRVAPNKSTVMDNALVASPIARAPNPAKKALHPATKPKSPIATPAAVNTLKGTDSVTAAPKSAPLPGLSKKPQPPTHTEGPVATHVAINMLRSPPNTPAVQRTTYLPSTLKEPPLPTETASPVAQRAQCSTLSPLSLAPAPLAASAVAASGAIGSTQSSCATVYQPPASIYTECSAVNEIAYDPMAVFKEGLSMAQAIKDGVRTIDLGNSMRQDVWVKEIDSLLQQQPPRTMIAVCGATGAGKSSSMNALLDDNIVPTSGLRACTAVATEISYHENETIDGDVIFLSLEDWKTEIGVLIHDLVDENGKIMRIIGRRDDARVAWSKLHAVYPHLTPERIAQMTAEEIIDCDNTIAEMLGQTINISAENSKIFAALISKYVDSQDQKSSKKNKKNGKSNSSSSNDKSGAEETALWPLIKLVKIRCKSKALATGAVLVDLPGVADANAARNQIAKDYMKRCDRIWVLAPISRAVDDKTAKDLLGEAFRMQLMMDGNYDSNIVTFVATKCDDISCSEIISGLGLQDDKYLVENEARIEACEDEIKTWKDQVFEAKHLIKEVKVILERLRQSKQEREAHLAILKNGAHSTPKLTPAGKNNILPVIGSKRKNCSSGKHGPPKRRKRMESGSEGDDDDDDDDDDDEDMYVDHGDHDVDMLSDDSAPSDVEAEALASGDDDISGESDTSSANSGGDSADESEEQGIGSLQAKIDADNESISVENGRLNNALRSKEEARKKIAELKKIMSRAQLQKTSFCSLKRSEHSKTELKEDFRSGLKELEDAKALEDDPNNFDPTQDIRDYAAVDLPVFCISSRDYTRLKKQVTGDGAASCFTELSSTGIPELQDWCRALAVKVSERAAGEYTSQLRTFVQQIKTYIEEGGKVTAADRQAMRQKWESPNNGGSNQRSSSSNDSMTCGGKTGSSDGIHGHDLLAHGAASRGPSHQAQGISDRLSEVLLDMVNDCIEDLELRIKTGLEEKCRIGAEEASAAAVTTSDEFAMSIHWQTYRATLRRHGEWRRSLNGELLAPMTRRIASSWAKVFETDILSTFSAKIEDAIKKLIREVETSASSGLKDRVSRQGQAALEEARVAIQKSGHTVEKVMNDEQKDISRCLAPHIQAQLRETYDKSLKPRGSGSVNRQKAAFHEGISSLKDRIFNTGSNMLLERLSEAAEAVWEALYDSSTELAKKVEVNMSVLWEGPLDNPSQIRARSALAIRTDEILGQLDIWTAAETLHNTQVVA